MTAFRCTTKLLKAMKAKPRVQFQPAPNRLGEWTSNFIRISHIQLVIAVNELTRFGVVIDAAPYATVPERFERALYHALVYIGIPAKSAAEELMLMYPFDLAVSNSRSVLGTLNQFAWQVECDLYAGLAHSSAELTQRLAETVVLKPEHIVYPVDRVREAFGLSPIDHRRCLADSLLSDTGPSLQRG